MAERQLPWSKDAEKSFIGALLIDGDAAQQARDLLPPVALYMERHRTIYRALLSILDRGEAPDVVMLAEELRDHGGLEAVGGMEYLAHLLDHPPSPNATDYATVIRRKAVQRHLIRVAGEIADSAYKAPHGDVEELVDQAETAILDVSASTTAGEGYASSSDLVMTFLDAVDRRRERPHETAGLETGFADLDNLTDGLHPGELIVIAGRPSMGKTALTLDVTRHAILELGKPAAIFSLEMPKRQLVGRLACAEAHLPYQRIRAGQVRDGEHGLLADAAGALKQAPLYVADSTGLTIHSLRSTARRIRDREGLALLAVDYLQLMSGPADAGTREQEIASISRALKELALELEIPVIAISQLSRQPEMRAGNARPRLSDLRESGAIEQDADVVVFVYREELYLEPTDERWSEVKDRAELIVGKQRNGPTGTIELRFNKSEIRFESVASLGARRSA